MRTRSHTGCQHPGLRWTDSPDCCKTTLHLHGRAHLCCTQGGIHGHGPGLQNLGAESDFRPRKRMSLLFLLKWGVQILCLFNQNRTPRSDSANLEPSEPQIMEPRHGLPRVQLNMDWAPKRPRAKCAEHTYNIDTCRLHDDDHDKSSPDCHDSPSIIVRERCPKKTGAMSKSEPA